jgi:hypothetical protein
MALYTKPIIFVVVSILAIVLISSPSSTFSAPWDGRSAGSVVCDSTGGQSANGLALVECCWHEKVTPGTGDPRFENADYERYCSECEDGGTRGKINCSDPELQFFTRTPGDLPEYGVLEQQPTPPTSGPAAPLQGGVLEQLEQGEATPGFMPGFLQRQQQQPPPTDQGAAELPPPATEETQPATAEEDQPVPVCQEGLEFNEDLGFCVPEDCPDGQVLDEESGICVLEEPETAEEEEPAQSEPGEQPSDEPDQEGDTNNN